MRRYYLLASLLLSIANNPVIYAARRGKTAAKSSRKAATTTVKPFSVSDSADLQTALTRQRKVGGKPPDATAGIAGLPDNQLLQGPGSSGILANRRGPPRSGRTIEPPHQRFTPIAPRPGQADDETQAAVPLPPAVASEERRKQPTPPQYGSDINIPFKKRRNARPADDLFPHRDRQQGSLETGTQTTAAPPAPTGQNPLLLPYLPPSQHDAFRKRGQVTATPAPRMHSRDTPAGRPHHGQHFRRSSVISFQAAGTAAASTSFHAPYPPGHAATSRKTGFQHALLSKQMSDAASAVRPFLVAPQQLAPAAHQPQQLPPPPSVVHGALQGGDKSYMPSFCGASWNSFLEEPQPHPNATPRLPGEKVLTFHASDSASTSGMSSSTASMDPLQQTGDTSPRFRALDPPPPPPQTERAQQNAPTTASRNFQPPSTSRSDSANCFSANLVLFVGDDVDPAVAVRRVTVAELHDLLRRNNIDPRHFDTLCRPLAQDAETTQRALFITDPSSGPFAKGVRFFRTLEEAVASYKRDITTNQRNRNSQQQLVSPPEVQNTDVASTSVQDPDVSSTSEALGVSLPRVPRSSALLRDAATRQRMVPPRSSPPQAQPWSLELENIVYDTRCHVMWVGNKTGVRPPRSLSLHSFLVAIHDRSPTREDLRSFPFPYRLPQEIRRGLPSVYAVYLCDESLEPMDRIRTFDTLERARQFYERWSAHNNRGVPK